MTSTKSIDVLRKERAESKFSRSSFRLRPSSASVLNTTHQASMSASIQRTLAETSEGAVAPFDTTALHRAVRECLSNDLKKKATMMLQARRGGDGNVTSSSLDEPPAPDSPCPIGASSSPALVNLLCYRGSLSLLQSKLPTLQWYFSDLTEAINNVEADFSQSLAQLEEKRNRLEQVDRTVGERVSRVKVLCEEQVKQAIRDLDRRDREIESSEQLNDRLSQRVKDLEEKNLQLRRLVQNLERKEHDHDREAEMRRSQVNEFQSKSHVIVQENQYLREICRHNRDLLQEIEELRDENAKNVEKAAKERENLIKGKEAADREADASLGALRRLTKQVDAMQHELTTVKDALAQSEDLCVMLQAEKQQALGIVTPRPNRSSLQQVFDNACQVLNEPLVSVKDPHPNGMRTTAVEGNLVRLLQMMTERFRTVSAKSEKQAQLLEYLSLEDFEFISRGLSTRLASIVGDSEAPEAKKGGLSLAMIKPSLIPAPVHSRTIVASGCWVASGSLSTAAPLLHFGVGAVGCRLLALEELLLLIDDIRSERKGVQSPLQCLVQPLAHHIRRYISLRNSSNPMAAQEQLMSFDYSLDLHRYSPAADAFRKVVKERTIPEGLYQDILNNIDALCRDIQALPQEQLRPVAMGKSPVRVLRRKQFFQMISQQFPFLSETSIFRLKAVLQAELQRLAMVDAKFVAGTTGRDEVVVDLLIGPSLGGDDQNDPSAALALGSGVRPNPRDQNFFKRPNSSVMMPFSAALFRCSVEEYELFQQNLCIALCAVLFPASEIEGKEDAAGAVPLTGIPGWDVILQTMYKCRQCPVSKGQFQAALVKVLTPTSATSASLDATALPSASLVQETANIVTQFVFDAEAVKALHGHSPSIGSTQANASLPFASVVQLLRQVLFPTPCRCGVNGSTLSLCVDGASVFADGAKLVDQMRKSVNLLRSLQK